MGRIARKFQPFFEAISRDIFAYCRAWNFHPTWQQADFLQAVQDATYGTGPRKIACKSGQGPGKTTASVMAGTWRAIRFVGALTMVTAPTMAQCKEVWLSECRRRIANADPMIQQMIEVTKSRIIICGRHDWGVKFVTATRPENAQGRHEEHMTWIAEEASGIPRPLITQIEGTLSNMDDLFIQIGNPNTRDCAFFDCFTIDRHHWRCITFNAELSPICNPATHKYLEEKYGRESDVYRVRVLGEFPYQDPTCIMSSDDVEACGRLDLYAMVKVPRNLDGKSSPAKQISIDFAAFGGDETVIYRRSGEAIVEQFARPHIDPMHSCDKAIFMQKKAKWRDKHTVYVPDCNGIGDGAVGRFYDAQLRVFEFRSNHASQDPQYDNRATEAYFDLADKVKAHAIYIPRDEQLIQQLTTRQYHITKKGKIALEDKEHYKKRGYLSPDKADSLVMASFDKVQAMSSVAVRGASDKRVGIAVRRAG